MTSIGAVRKIAQMEPGATVAVFGLGTVGLSVSSIPSAFFMNGKISISSTNRKMNLD